MEIRVQLSASDAQNEILQGPRKGIIFVGADMTNLAIMQAAVANSGGGRIYIGVRSRGASRPAEITGLGTTDQPLFQKAANQSSHATVPIISSYFLTVGEKKIFVQEIAAHALDLHAADGSSNNSAFQIHDGTSLKTLTASEAMEILRSRRGAAKPVFTMPEPLLRELKLRWVDFPANMNIYDPETRCVVWRSVPMRQSPSGTFTCSVEVGVSRPQELFDQKVLTGEVEIEIENVLLGNPNLRTYDGLGRPISLTWRASTQLHSKISLSLAEILRKRPFYPSRSLTIDGIEPKIERLRDIVRILNDIGIVVTNTQSLSFGMPSLKNGIRLVGEHLGPRGISRIECEIRGTPVVLKSRFRRGPRMDDKEVASGAIQIMLRGHAEESHRNLSDLLNGVVENIHRRLDYLRVE